MLLIIHATFKKILHQLFWFYIFKLGLDKEELQFLQKTMKRHEQKIFFILQKLLTENSFLKVITVAAFIDLFSHH